MATHVLLPSGLAVQATLGRALSGALLGDVVVFRQADPAIVRVVGHGYDGSNYTELQVDAWLGAACTATLATTIGAGGGLQLLATANGTECAPDLVLYVTFAHLWRAGAVSAPFRSRGVCGALTSYVITRATCERTRLCAVTVCARARARCGLAACGLATTRRRPRGGRGGSDSPPATSRRSPFAHLANARAPLSAFLVALPHGAASHYISPPPRIFICRRHAAVLFRSPPRNASDTLAVGGPLRSVCCGVSPQLAGRRARAQAP